MTKAQEKAIDDIRKLVESEPSIKSGFERIDKFEVIGKWEDGGVNVYIVTCVRSAPAVCETCLLRVGRLGGVKYERRASRNRDRWRWVTFEFTHGGLHDARKSFECH